MSDYTILFEAIAQIKDETEIEELEIIESKEIEELRRIVLETSEVPFRCITTT